MIYRGLSATAHPGYLAQVFVDTGANCNTISRTFFEQLIERGLVSELVKGPEVGVRINLVGGRTLGISGDKAIMEVDVATTMGIKTAVQDFLILEHDSEPLVMGVQWHSSLVEENGRFDPIGQYGYFWPTEVLWMPPKIKPKKTLSWMMPTWMYTQEDWRRPQRLTINVFLPQFS